MARTRRALLAALATVAGCSTDRAGSPTAATTSDTGTPTSTASPTPPGTESPTERQAPTRVELDDDRVRWRVDFPGERVVAPVAAGGRLFVGIGGSTVGTSTQGEEIPGLIGALSLPTGDPVWHHPTTAPVTGLETHDGGLYATAGYSSGYDGVDQQFHRYSADGQHRWATPKRDAWLSVYDFDDKRAYLGTGDDALGSSGETTFAVDLETGTERWAVEGGDAYTGRVAGETLYADYGGAAIASLVTTDGSNQWTRGVEALHGYDQSFPAASGHLFAAIEEDDSYGIAGIDAADGSTSWTHGLDAASPFVVTSATAVGNAVVATEYDGLLFARDAATGDSLWRRKFDGRIRPPLFSARTLYCSVRDGPLVAVDAVSGDELWRAEGDSDYPRFSMADETLVAVTHGSGETRIEARSASDGSLRWHRTIPDEVTAVEQTGHTLTIATKKQSVYGVDVS